MRKAVLVLLAIIIAAGAVYAQSAPLSQAPPSVERNVETPVGYLNVAPVERTYNAINNLRNPITIKEFSFDGNSLLISFNPNIPKNIPSLFKNGLFPLLMGSFKNPNGNIELDGAFSVVGPPMTTLSLKLKFG